MIHRSLILFLTLFLTSLSQAQFGASSSKSTFKAVSEVTEIAPGETFKVAVQLKHPEKWHSYFVNPGVLGSSMEVKWELPEGFKASETIFPIPKAIDVKVGELDAVMYGYEGEVDFFFEITAPDNLEAGTDIAINGKANWQICDDTGCIMEDGQIALTIKGGAETVADSANAEFFSGPPLSKPAEGWSFEVTEEEGSFELTATAPAGVSVEEDGVYFFSTDLQVDSQSLQDAEVDGQTVIVYFGRNYGEEDLFIDEGPVLDTLSGVLAYQTADGESAINVSIPLEPNPEGEDPANAAKTSKPAVHLALKPATPEDIAAGAEVYDLESKPEVVNLSGKKEEKITFFTGLGLLFVGGLLLNLMPCVFPVLGIKVMGFVAQAGEDEKKIKVHGMVFGLGLLVAMWILAAVVISLGLKWGDQLNNPVFLGTMIVFFVLMGLNLYGVFEIGTSLTSVGGDLQGQKGYSGSFFSGVLTTLVATPCSGPFLGVAMAFALALPNSLAFVAFTVFGLGIASPYILLSFFPALIKKLPKPGPWMVSFKQIMSFLLFATAVYFMRGYMKMVGDSHFNFFLFALVMIGMGAYIYGRWGLPSIPKVKRYVSGFGLGGVLVFGGLTWAYSTAKPPKEGLSWQEWYPGVMDLSRAKGRIVWVDYTAET